MHPDVDDLIPPELAVEVEPFTLEQLDEYLDRPVVPAEEATPDDEPAAGPVSGFVIPDDDLAEWAMAHMAAIAANEAMLAEQTAARHARIQRHHDAAMARLTKRRGFFEAALIAYGRRFHDRDPKRNKTLHLPSGVVKSTTSRPKVAVDPSRMDELVAWVDGRYRDDEDTRDTLVQTTRKPMVGALRKVTEVRSIQVGIAVTLECGHIVGSALVDGDGVPVEDFMVDSTTTCDECQPDPLDGPAERRVVATEPVMELVACDDAGVPVPGTQVDPGGTSFSVVPS